MNLYEFIKDAKNSGIDWLKSQLILSGSTFLLTFIGLLIVDQKFANIGNVVGLIFICLGLAIVDFIPVIGISAVMLPWAVLAALTKNTKLGICIFVVFVVVMIIKQILEPFIRGKSLGISPIEEVIASVLGYLICGTNAIGFILGPIVYIVGKKTYVKFTGKQIGGGKGNGYFNKSNSNDDNIIDITDDVEE